MKHIIITGHSKGLGAGIAGQLLNENHHIHGVSRSHNEQLQKLANAAGCKMDFYQCDLSYSDAIEPVMDRIFLNVAKDERLDGVYLINNAGVAGPIGPIEKIDPEGILLHLRINLIAPFLLTREFLRHTASMQVQKRIINISSGAAKSPYDGMSIYCTGKAGLDMLTQCVGVEQEKREFPVEVMSVAPGIIDTEMQTYMRNVPDEDFSQKQKFVNLKENGELVLPEIAGSKLADLLFSENFRNGDIIDIRHLY
jgi:benzil reductase ((S)-benzoin forming)